MSIKIEQVLPPIMDQGLLTDENTTLGGTLAVTGASTFTGAAQFNGAVTFAGAVGGGLYPIVSATTNATLTTAQAGATVLFNSTTGVQVTLPSPTAGLCYDFVVQQTPGTGTHGIVTSSGSVFLGGGLTISVTNGSTATFVANPASTTKVNLNGTTTGGTTGTWFRATCISSTVWMVNGFLTGSSTLATPFN